MLNSKINKVQQKKKYIISKSLKSLETDYNLYIFHCLSAYHFILFLSDGGKPSIISVTYDPCNEKNNFP